MKYTKKDVRDALELYVKFGVLLKTKINKEDAWKENPEFNKKSKAEQDEIFELINSSRN